MEKYNHNHEEGKCEHAPMRDSIFILVAKILLTLLLFELIYGAVFYMESVSSNQGEFFNQYSMPTLGLDDVDQATRDQKVKELYPLFENKKVLGRKSFFDLLTKDFNVRGK